MTIRSEIDNNQNGLVIQLKCECTGKTYPNLNALKIHKTSKIHLTWECKNEVRNLEIRSTKLENDNDLLKRTNVNLLDRIDNLKRNEVILLETQVNLIEKIKELQH